MPRPLGMFNGRRETQAFVASPALDGTGRGVSFINGPGPWRRWTITGFALTGSSAITPKFTLYRNSESPPNVLGTSYNANGDQSAGADPLYPGELVVCVWASGSPGAVLTCVMSYIDEPYGGTS